MSSTGTRYRQQQSTKMIQTNNSKILVAVAAFDEKYVKTTIESGLDNAHDKSNIVFGINYQSSDGCFDDLSEYSNNVKVVYSVSEFPRGLGADRMVASSFWNGEKYFFQIDGHMLFEPNWDICLIDALESIKKSGFEKPIISTFVPWWSVSEDGDILHYAPGTVNCCSVCSYEAGDINSLWLEPKRVFNETVCGKEIKEHHTISAHYMFTHANWLEEVGHDARIIWIGDEHMIAMRSWTRGYRIFSIGQPYAWHLNKGAGKQAKDWRHSIRNNHHNRDSFRFKLDFERTRKFLTGQEFGHGGAPNETLLKMYEKASGLNFVEMYDMFDRCDAV